MLCNILQQGETHDYDQQFYQRHITPYMTTSMIYLLIVVL